MVEPNTGSALCDYLLMQFPGCFRLEEMRAVGSEKTIHLKPGYENFELIVVKPLGNDIFKVICNFARSQGFEPHIRNAQQIRFKKDGQFIKYVIISQFLNQRATDDRIYITIRPWGEV
jgi:hypothetical protein